MTSWGIFLIILAVFLLLIAIGLFGHSQYKAGKLNRILPVSARRDAGAYRAPAPAPSGIQGWVSDKWNALRNKRTAGGAYESTGYGGSRSVGRDRRGFGPLDPDGAWDARVDHEADFAGAYYEEQELGDPGHGPYGGGGYGEVGASGVPETRGRSKSRQRELDNRYDEEMHHGGVGGGTASSTTNPFSDNNALRAASPRPILDTASAPRGAPGHNKQQSSLSTTHSTETSPTERRSMFRENM